MFSVNTKLYSALHETKQIKILDKEKVRRVLCSQTVCVCCVLSVLTCTSESALTGCSWNQVSFPWYFCRSSFFTATLPTHTLTKRQISTKTQLNFILPKKAYKFRGEELQTPDGHPHTHALTCLLMHCKSTLSDTNKHLVLISVAWKQPLSFQPWDLSFFAHHTYKHSHKQTRRCAEMQNIFSLWLVIKHVRPPPLGTPKNSDRNICLCKQTHTPITHILLETLQPLFTSNCSHPEQLLNGY